jgi:2-pyrone-4,6-dicarboxylate lactonase
MLQLLPPHPAPHPPGFEVPANACDSHCHLFGPAKRFPYAPDRSYTPADSGFESYQDLRSTLGLARAVLVQPACYGSDHSALLDGLARAAGRFRGVALVKPDATAEQLLAFDRAGVRAARFNLLPHLSGAVDLTDCQRIAPRVLDLGWHVALHLTPAALLALAPEIAALPCPFVIDHLGRIETRRGLEQDAFLTLLELMKLKHAWVKLSGADRSSASGPPYEDVIPFAQRLIEAAPERVLWGTDWPHPNVRAMPDDGDLMDLLARFAPDAQLRKQILVDNPDRLYRFEPSRL